MTKATQLIGASSAAVMFFAMTLCLCCSIGHAGQGDRIVCPRVVSTDMSASLEAFDPNRDNFYEVSGLGFSPTRVGPSGEPLLYAVNDGGDRRMGVWDSGTGDRLLSLRMPRHMPLALDKEAMAVGSCGIDGQDSTCIYVADVGDNTARDNNGTISGHDRAAYPIWKIREPDIGEYEDNDILPDSEVTRLYFNYFHSSSPTLYADCEAAFLDHTGWGGGDVGDFYLLTKWEDYGDNAPPANTLVRLFKIPADAWEQANNDEDFVASPEAVGNYASGPDSNALMGYMWTRAEMSFDGTVIALGDYYDQYLYLRCPGMSVADALAVPGTRFCETWPIEYWDSQFETIAWAPDGSTLEVSECWGSSCNPDPPMVWTTMDYDPNNGGVACPASVETPPTTAVPTAAQVPPPTVAPTSAQTPPPTTTEAQDPPPSPTPPPTSQQPPLVESGSEDISTSGSALLFRRTIHIASVLVVVAMWVQL